MLLHDKLVTELIILGGVRPTYQKAALELFQKWTATQDPAAFIAYMQATFELGKKDAVIQFISRMLDESDDA